MVSCSSVSVNRLHRSAVSRTRASGVGRSSGFRSQAVALPFEFQWGQLSEAGVRTHVVEVTPELLDHYLRVDPILEPLHAQTLVAELAVEGLVRAVLPGLARIDVGGIDVRLREPLQDGAGDELRAVIRTQVLRCTMHSDELGEHLDYATGADAPGDIDRQALPSVLVDHGEALELLPVRARVE